jgi:hypothetical protein
MFHPKTDEMKPRWSVPAAQWAAFQTVIVKHWVNHSGLVEAVQAAQSYKPEPEAAKPAAKPQPSVTITETDDGWLKVKSPYNAEFISELKSAFYWKTRKWNGQEKVWEVDVAHKSALVKMVTEIYKSEPEVVEA